MAGRGAFIDSVIDAVTVYYREVLQNLSAWHARPPKLPHVEGPIEADKVQVPEAVEAALQQAESEASTDSQLTQEG